MRWTPPAGNGNRLRLCRSPRRYRKLYCENRRILVGAIAILRSVPTCRRPSDLHLGTLADL